MIATKIISKFSLSMKRTFNCLLMKVEKIKYNVVQHKNIYIYNFVK